MELGEGIHGESRAKVEPVNILADEVGEFPGSMESHQGEMGESGLGRLEARAKAFLTREVLSFRLKGPHSLHSEKEKKRKKRNR